jgi:hypothetical protein
VTTRILVVDLLSSRIRPQQIAGGVCKGFARFLLLRSSCSVVHSISYHFT